MTKNNYNKKFNQKIRDELNTKEESEFASNFLTKCLANKNEKIVSLETKIKNDIDHLFDRFDSRFAVLNHLKEWYPSSTEEDLLKLIFEVEKEISNELNVW